MLYYAQRKSYPIIYLETVPAQLQRYFASLHINHSIGCNLSNQPCYFNFTQRTFSHQQITSQHHQINMYRQFPN